MHEPLNELLHIAAELQHTAPPKGYRTPLASLPQVTWHVASQHGRTLVNFSLPRSKFCAADPQPAVTTWLRLWDALKTYELSAAFGLAGYQCRMNAANVDSPVAMRTKMMAESTRRYIVTNLRQRGEVPPFTRMTENARTARPSCLRFRCMNGETLPVILSRGETGALVIAPNAAFDLSCWSLAGWRGSSDLAVIDAALKARLTLADLPFAVVFNEPLRLMVDSIDTFDILAA